MVVTAGAGAGSWEAAWTSKEMGRAGVGGGMGPRAITCTEAVHDGDWASRVYQT